VLIVLGIAAEIVFALALRSVDPNQYLGITGVVGVAIPMLIALEDRAAALVVAVVGALIFVVVVGYGSPPEPVGYGIPLIALWTGLTWVTASVAGSLRSRSRQAVDDAHAAAEETERLHREILRALVPSPAIRSENVRVRVAYAPGEQRLEFGGDFFDAVERDDGTIAVLVGDVSGHGTDAAAIGATLRAGWRAMVVAGLSPRDRLEALHQLLLRDARSEEFFATVCSCVISPDRRSATVISAGHPTPILIGAETAPLAIVPGPPLGLPIVGHPWQPTIIELEQAFSLLFYTDGIVEGHAGPGQSGRFGVEGLLGAVGERAGQSARLLDGVMSAAETANGGRLADDVALVLLTLEGLPAAEEAPRAAQTVPERGPSGELPY
jgi:serine phosphatase RsbU (regulator of sigma subunit)